MAITYDKPYFLPKNPLGAVFDSVQLLRRSNVDFIPANTRGGTIRTRPFIEDDRVNWRERFLDAAMIYLTNPLCFAAQTLRSDTIADAPLIVEEKQGTQWVYHDQNPLYQWLEQPNENMDSAEFVKAIDIHRSTFGCNYNVMFQKGDPLPNGHYCQRDNNFEVVFPARIIPDNETSKIETLWWYIYHGAQRPIPLDPANLFIDVVYNPIAHQIGVSLPNNPLKLVFEIHNNYMKGIARLFKRGGIPKFLLTRAVDIQKDPNFDLEDNEVEEAVERVYARVGEGGSDPNGILGMKGDWRFQKVGSYLPELMSKDLLHYIESLVQSVYGVPPSLFWVGLQLSNQRASRQQDSLDFYNQTVHPAHQRIEKRLTRWAVPKFLPGKEGKFRIHFDTDNMPLAQYVRSIKNREAERQWQMQLLNRGEARNALNLPINNLTDEEKKEYYSGTRNEENLSVGTGDQSLQKDNGLE